MKKIKRKLYAYVPVRDEAEAKKRAEEEQKRNNLNWLLVRSCGAGDVIFARALLEAGANPSFRDVNGESALQQSIHKGNLNLVELLLRHGANPNQVTAAFPILMEAVFYRQPEIIRALARAGANVNAQTKTGLSALLLATQKGDMDLVRVLIEVAADPNIKSCDGRTPIFWAQKNGNKEIERILRKAGARETKAEMRVDEFITAAATGDMRAMKRLLATGVDVNAKDTLENKQRTALHAAASAGRDAAADFLLRQGADIEARALPDETPLMLAAAHGNFEGIRRLLTAGAKLETRNRDKRTALVTAIACKQLKAVKVLLEAGARVDVSTKMDGTPLGLAALQGNTKIVAALLKSGAEPNKADDQGDTPLMRSVLIRRVVEILLKAGANVNAVNKEGLTALDIARNAQQGKVVQILKAVGAKSGKELGSRETL